MGKWERMNLPKSKHRLGYNDEEIRSILKDQDVSERDFCKAFGVHTCHVDIDGNSILYRHDVQKALIKAASKKRLNV